MVYEIIENKDETVSIFKNKELFKIFVPTINLDNSLKLLIQFNNIIIENEKISARWKYSEYYIFPALQEWLFWDYFVPVVQHHQAIVFLKGKNFKFKKNNHHTNSRLQKYFSFLRNDDRIYYKKLLNLISNILLKVINIKEKIVINDEGITGFRYESIKRELSLVTDLKRVQKINRITYPNLKVIKNTLYFGFADTSKNKIKFSIDISDYPILEEFLTQDELIATIKKIDNKCRDIIYQCNMLIKKIGTKLPKLLITYDQVETILPLLIILREKKIKVISYQHGVLTKFHAGWMGHGIEEKYCNAVPDKLIVWGNYWKEILIKHSNKYNQSNIIVGAHLNKKINYNWEKKNLVNPKCKKIKILVPFEFIAANIEISNYIEKFIDFGWQVKIKIRPKGNGDINFDKLAYSKLIQNECEFKYDFCNEELNEIHAVVCTQSSFGMEMMRFNKPIWYLETKFKFMDDILKNIAHRINIKTCSELKEMRILEKFLIPKYNLENYKNFFSDLPLKDTISKIISEKI